MTCTGMQWRPVVGEAEYAIGSLLETFDYSRVAVIDLNATTRSWTLRLTELRRESA